MESNNEQNAVIGSIEDDAEFHRLCVTYRNEEPGFHGKAFRAIAAYVKRFQDALAAGVRNSALEEAITVCYRVVASRARVDAIGDAAHYAACADGIRALKCQPVAPRSKVEGASELDIDTAEKVFHSAWSDQKSFWACRRDGLRAVMAWCAQPRAAAPERSGTTADERDAVIDECIAKCKKRLHRQFSRTIHAVTSCVSALGALKSQRPAPAGNSSGAPSELSARLRQIYVAYDGHGEEVKGVAAQAADELDRLAAPSPTAVSNARSDPLHLPTVLREFAADSGYSHNDYADVMRQAAEQLERISPPSVQGGVQEGLFDEDDLANACIECTLPDFIYESLCVALKRHRTMLVDAAPPAAPARELTGDEIANLYLNALGERLPNEHHEVAFIIAKLVQLHLSGATPARKEGD